MYWKPSHRFDPKALPLADMHYSRQKVGSNQYIAPGSPIALLGLNNDALWVTLKQKIQDHEWKGAWSNPLFNNQSLELSSDLIIQACAVTRFFWGVNEHGIITMINTKKVRPKKDFGYCYLKAGFRKVGYTKVHKHLVLKLFPEDFPLPQAPLNFQGVQAALFDI